MIKTSKKLIYASVCTLMLFLITSCGSESKNAALESTTESATSLKDVSKTISQMDFDAAMKNANIFQDEFLGNFEITVDLDTDAKTKVDNAYIDLGVDITRENENSDIEFILLSEYIGKGWMFHDEVNLKSPNGVMNLNEMISEHKQVMSGGIVFEVSSRVLKDKEVQEFCKVLDSNDVKFRLRGIGGEVLELTGQMTNASLKANQTLCTIYFGIKQGFTISK